jgi:two-component system sensor histidine kinase/response regulator
MTAASIGGWSFEGGLSTRRPTSRLRTPAGRRFAIAAAAALVAIVAFLIWTALHIGGSATTVAVDDIGEAFAALLAAASCGYATRHATGRLRLAWGLLGASALSWGVGEVIWSYYEVFRGVQVPFPSIADAGFLGAIPLAIAGVLAFPAAPGRVTTRAQALLDGAIVALSLVFVGWGLGLGRVYQTSSDQPLVQLLGAAYPVSDIVILAVLLLVLRRAAAAQRGAMLLLLGGLGANAVADSAFAYLTASGQYTVNGSMLDAGWVIGFLLIGLAPLWPAPFAGTTAEEAPVDLWQMAIPWISLFGVAAVALVNALYGRGLDTFMTAIGGGLGALLVASIVLLYRDSLATLAVHDRAESELEQRTTLLNQVVTHAPLGVARVGVDLRILDANPRLGALLHAPAKVMLGSLVSDYLSPESMTQLIETSKPLWEGRVETVEGNSPVRRADSSEVWLHWSVTAVRKPGGNIDYFLAMFEDITAKHEAEETTMANLAGLERLNQLKSEFVSMVSHEFRTALVGIQGFSELIRDEEMGGAEIKGLAGDINKDAMRLNRMITEMLDLDRMEAGKIRMYPKPTDMNVLVREAVDRARATTGKHTIRMDLDQALPIVTGDTDRLTQVLSNLLSNAIKYSPDGGEVRVTTRTEGDRVCVSVRDQGLGIPPEFVDRLFGRYERFESNHTNQVIGTGLGLVICRQIVELHGGKIWVDSAVGAGSNFQFSVPIRSETLSAAV